MFTFLLVVHGLIAAALVGVILVQKSEGGGLGMGSGGPSGLMTARGAADFLTRATTVLATLFILMALALAAFASLRNGGGSIDTSLARQGQPGPINAPAAPTSAIPMMGAPAPTPAAPEGFVSPATPASAPARSPGNAADPAADKHAAASRPVPSVKTLHTIDTPVGNSTVGINGVGWNTGRSASPTVAVPAIKAPAPTKSDPSPIAAPTTSTGNNSQP